MSSSPHHARPPDASGVFTKTPFAQLLAYCFDKRLSGTFELSNHGGEAATIVVHEGGVLKVKTTGPGIYLGQILFELGHLDAESLNGSLMELAKRTAVHGEILVRTRKINSRQLREGLETQAARKVHHVFGFSQDTTFAFYKGEDFLVGYGGLDYPVVDPFPLIWRGVREHPIWEHVQGTLARVGDGFCGIIPGAQLERFAFQDEQRGAIDCLRARPMGISELSNIGIVTPNTARLLVYCLLLTRQVAFAESRRTSDPNQSVGAYRSSPRIPAASASREMPAAEVAARHPGARPPTSAAMPAAAPVSPPSSPSHVAVRPSIAGAHPGARTVPGTATVSRASIEAAHPPLGARPSSAKIEELEGAPAKTLFQEAEVSLARKDLDRAERLCRRAHALETENADYLALLAWVESQRPENQSPQATQQRVSMLDRAVSLDKECERAYFYRAQLHKRVENLTAALRDFRVTAKLNPNNIEAAREVRLHDMRSRNSSGEFNFGRRTTPHPSSPSPAGGTRKPEPKSSSSGFLDRLLKK